MLLIMSYLHYFYLLNFSTIFQLVTARQAFFKRSHQIYIYIYIHIYIYIYIIYIYIHIYIQFFSLVRQVNLRKEVVIYENARQFFLKTLLLLKLQFPPGSSVSKFLFKPPWFPVQALFAHAILLKKRGMRGNYQNRGTELNRESCYTSQICCKIFCNID